MARHYFKEYVSYTSKLISDTSAQVIGHIFFFQIDETTQYILSRICNLVMTRLFSNAWATFFLFIESILFLAGQNTVCV